MLGRALGAAAACSSFNLAGNAIGDAGAAALAAALRKGAAPKLEWIVLSENAIGDAGLAALAAALLEGAAPKLERISLDGNPASAAAVLALKLFCVVQGEKWTADPVTRL